MKRTKKGTTPTKKIGRKLPCEHVLSSWMPLSSCDSGVVLLAQKRRQRANPRPKIPAFHKRVVSSGNDKICVRIVPRPPPKKRDPCLGGYAPSQLVRRPRSHFLDGLAASSMWAPDAHPSIRLAHHNLRSGQGMYDTSRNEDFY